MIQAELDRRIVKLSIGLNELIPVAKIDGRSAIELTTMLFALL